MGSSIDISIIVPCYNAEQYLGDCLASLRRQETPRIEMILIDDGSDDATGAMLDAFAQTEARARVLHIKNNGVSAARNRGIETAQGRYLAFADADDILVDNGLDMLYRAAVSSGAQIISADHTILDMGNMVRTEIKADTVHEKPAEVAHEIIHMHRIYNNLWNKLYERTLFAEDIRLNERVRIGEDALLNLQLYLRAKSCGHVAKSTYIYRVHARSAMANIGSYAKAHEPMLRGMSEVLLTEKAKERFFRDYLQSSIWVYEKETGIFRAMKQFNRTIRPLVLDGVTVSDVLSEDTGLCFAVRVGVFPILYVFLRIGEKITKKKWGIRR